MNGGNPFRRIYGLLDHCYGAQHWWPADSSFEVMVGAVLVQNTAWSNASSAIAQLRKHGMLSIESILAVEDAVLARTIVSCGYYNIKARRLKSLCQWLESKGGIDAVRKQPLEHLRGQLLTVHGIGRETADDILLYALDKPVFVIDAYTRRLFSRLGLVEHDAGYESLRRSFEQALDKDVALFNQYHALIVHHAKHVCRKKPQCDSCCLYGECRYATGRQALI
ncbi:MAG: endonuclease III domain-containing protein [Gammaproteobacteria bacterium]|jgi:endonuclease-3 related protein